MLLGSGEMRSESPTNRVVGWWSSRLARRPPQTVFRPSTHGLP